MNTKKTEPKTLMVHILKISTGYCAHIPTLYPLKAKADTLEEVIERITYEVKFFKDECMEENGNCPKEVRGEYELIFKIDKPVVNREDSPALKAYLSAEGEPMAEGRDMELRYVEKFLKKWELIFAILGHDDLNEGLRKDIFTLLKGGKGVNLNKTSYGKKRFLGN